MDTALKLKITKWTFVILLITLIITVIISTVSVSGSVYKDVSTTLAVTYTVKEYNGRVAVFSMSNVTPYKVYDTFTQDLPPSDQESLKAGITLKSEEELEMLIEDLTS